MVIYFVFFCVCSFNPSPLVRSSVWTVIFGLSVYWCAGFGAAQSCIQKLLSIGDRKSAQKYELELINHFYLKIKFSIDFFLSCC